MAKARKKSDVRDACCFSKQTYRRFEYFALFDSKHCFISCFQMLFKFIQIGWALLHFFIPSLDEHVGEKVFKMQLGNVYG